MRFLAFGCEFIDYDADGWKDLIVGNGHVQKYIEESAEGTTYRERKHVLREQVLTSRDVNA